MLPSHPAVPVGAAQRAELLAFACATAAAAGRHALQWFRQAVVVDDKRPEGVFDPVTAADRAVEAEIRARIRARWPDHGILGEEHGHEPGRSGLTWVIDPIDGTRAFITGALHWGVLLALHDGEGPLLGVMVQPYVDEVWSGDGDCAWLERAGERRRLQVRPAPALAAALVATTSPDAFPDAGRRAAFDALATQVRMVRYGTDCYGYALLAAGQFDLVVESGLKAWDIQALIPIIRGAGGTITGWDGGNPAAGGDVVAAGSAELAAAARHALAAARGGSRPA